MDRHVDFDTDMSTMSKSYEILQYQFRQAAIFCQAITVIFMKVHHLDEIRRNYGSSAAAGVLMDIKRLIGENIRRSDREMTYARDEVMIILPDTPQQGAGRIASKLQRVVGSFTFATDTGDDITLTPRLGIASYTYRTEPRMGHARAW